MKGGKKAAESLQKFLYENYGEMDCTVGVGGGIPGTGERLLVYVQRGKKHMKVVPQEWEGFTVWTKWTGKVAPA